MTTGGYGYTVERSIAYAYLPPEHAEPGHRGRGRDLRRVGRRRGRRRAALRPEGRADPGLAAAQPPQRSPRCVGSGSARWRSSHSEPTVCGSIASSWVPSARNTWAVVSTSPAASWGRCDREPELARQRGEADRLRPRLAAGASGARGEGVGVDHRVAEADPGRRAAPGARTAPRASRRGRRATLPASATSSSSSTSLSGGAPTRSSLRSPWMRIDSGPGIRRGRTRRLRAPRTRARPPSIGIVAKATISSSGRSRPGGLEVEHAEGACRQGVRGAGIGVSRRRSTGERSTPRPRSGAPRELRRRATSAPSDGPEGVPQVTARERC